MLLFSPTLQFGQKGPPEKEEKEKKARIAQSCLEKCHLLPIPRVRA
jgi:hypothetical protein